MTIPVEMFAIQKFLLTMLLLEITVDWVLYILTTNCLIEANLGETLSSKTRRLFSSKIFSDVFPVSTLSAILSLGSDLVDWYRDATPVPYRHLLIDFSPRTDHRLRYCTEIGSILSIFLSLNTRSFQTLWTRNTQNTSTLPIFEPFSQNCKKPFPQCFSKKYLLFLCECITNLFKRNLQSIRRYHVSKLQIAVQLLSLKQTYWKQRRDVLASEKKLQHIKFFTPPIISHLSWHGARYPGSCFSVQHDLVYPVSYKTETSNKSTYTKLHVPNWFI